MDLIPADFGHSEVQVAYFTDFLFVSSAAFGSKSNLCCRDNLDLQIA